MRNLRKFFIALACAATAALLAFGAVGCSKSIPQWIKEQQCGEHEWNNGEVTKVASCAEEGEMTYTCTECGKVDVQVLALLPHTELVVEKIDASCTKEGYTDGVICEVCETWVVERSVIPKKDHKVIHEKAVAPTCLTSGMTAYSYCSECEEVFKEKQTVAALGHKLVTIEGYSATCEESGLTNGAKCERCGTIYTEQEVVPALGHKDDNFDYSCDSCGALVGQLEKLESGLNLGFGRYRIYRQNETFSFDLLVAYDDEFGKQTGMSCVYVPALGDSSPETLDLENLSGEMITIYVDDTYIDIVIRDANGTYTAYGESYDIDKTAGISIQELITSFDLYKIA